MVYRTLVSNEDKSLLYIIDKYYFLFFLNAHIVMDALLLLTGYTVSPLNTGKDIEPLTATASVLVCNCHLTKPLITISK